MDRCPQRATFIPSFQISVSTGSEAASPGDTNKENTWATPGAKLLSHPENFSEGKIM